MPSLSYSEIQQQIKKRAFAPIYLLHGEEPFFIDLLADLMESNVLEEHEKAFNQTITYGSDVNSSQIRDMASRYPMMAPYQLIIIKEAQAISDIDGLLSYAQNPVNTTILVLCHKYKKLDSRKKLGATIKAKHVEFESKKIYDDKIPSWIAERANELKIKMAQSAAILLSEHIGNNLSNINNELEKLRLNIGVDQQITEDIIYKNVGISKEYNVFELQKALGQKDTNKAYRIAYYFIDNPKAYPFIATNTILFGYFQKLYKLYFCGEKDNASIAKFAGIPLPFLVPEFKQAARNYPLAKLEEIFHLIKEYDLKSKGMGADKLNNPEMLKELIFKITH
jgi:DNA polymerase-3 subunit delta